MITHLVLKLLLDLNMQLHYLKLVHNNLNKIQILNKKLLYCKIRINNKIFNHQSRHHQELLLLE
jgi:hypothetical protein